MVEFKGGAITQGDETDPVTGRVAQGANRTAGKRETDSTAVSEIEVEVLSGSIKGI